MMNDYNESISETLEVLKFLEKEILNKIPLETIKLLKEKASTSYVNKFEDVDEIDPNQLNEKTKDILAVLYIKYIANEEEKIEFNNKLYENEFKSNNQDYTIKKFEKKEHHEEVVLPVVPKKNFMQKILDKLFKFDTNK